MALIGVTNMNDASIAKAYLNKIDNAKSRGVSFNLPLLSYINVMKAKKCYFTGLTLTDNNRSIDRLDNKLGYVKGNVVACINFFNKLKGITENPNNDITVDIIIKGLEKVNNTDIK